MLVAHLETLDLDWVRPAGPFAAGMIATVKDADGNFVNSSNCRRDRPVARRASHRRRAKRRGQAAVGGACRFGRAVISPGDPVPTPLVIAAHMKV